MLFLNKKENVIDLKLTQYGKYLLSIGKLKPTYYAFFDDNILYNVDRASDAEQQNETEGRIQEDTPALQSQHVFHGIETEMQKINEVIRSSDDLEEAKETISLQSTPEKHFALTSPLGTSDLSKDGTPAWKLTFYAGELSGAISYVTGAHQTLRIPQIDVDITYETSIQTSLGKRAETSFGDRIEVAAPELISRTFGDGTFIDVNSKQFLLEIKEENAIYTNENFDIEVFLVETEDVSGTISTPGLSDVAKVQRERLVPLEFPSKPEQIRGGILLDHTQPVENITSRPNYVGYYLNVLSDAQIPENEICLAVNGLKSSGIRIESPIECADINDVPMTIYRSDVEPEQCDDE
tara:strand:+ start:2989 stop:4041 length:1053 start_codon:yes stop_codon:yes gene_type:complete